MSSLFSSLTGWTWTQVIDGFATTFSTFMATRLGKWIVSAFAFLGIDLTVYENIIAPWIDQARSAWEGIPGELMQWVVALRIDQVITIVLSAYGIAALKRLFFGKRST